MVNEADYQIQMSMSLAQFNEMKLKLHEDAYWLGYHAALDQAQEHYKKTKGIEKDGII